MPEAEGYIEVEGGREHEADGFTACFAEQPDEFNRLASGFLAQQESA